MPTIQQQLPQNKGIVTSHILMSKDVSIALELANASITQIHGRDDEHASLVAMKNCCSASETINLLCQFPATSY